MLNNRVSTYFPQLIIFFIFLLFTGIKVEWIDGGWSGYFYKGTMVNNKNRNAPEKNRTDFFTRNARGSIIGKINHAGENIYVLISPYDQGYRYQYKVNLHAHTTARDENYAYSPERLLKKAREYGFDAFAITDLPHAGGIVEDPGVDGILHIPGIEYGGRPHLIGLGIHSLTGSDDKQEQIDHIKKQNGLTYIPHPHWGGYDENLLSRLSDFDGIAVFNSLTYGVALSEKTGGEVLPFNESVIDALLSNGSPLAILAEEDTKYEDPHRYGHQLNTAWMKVWGDVPPGEIQVTSILKAIREKKFTSHGRHLRTHPEPPEFLEISTEELIIYVKINQPSDIEFITKGGEIKKLIKNTTSGSFEVSPDDIYVRIKASHTLKESSWAWTNPIYIENR